MGFACVVPTKFFHSSKYTLYCLVVPVLHDSMMMFQARSEMFCCLSLVLTRDVPSVEVWAIEGAVWSRCVVTGEGRRPPVQVLGG